jgi:molybdopterin-guanine dinucleotide biosynthesis protein A
MADPTLAGAILAGGRARRFGGRDKSRLLVDGRSIIVRQLELLQRLNASPFIVTSEADQRAHPDRFSDLGVPVYTDQVPEAGALGGIHAAVAQGHTAGADRVLVLACDLPHVTEALLRHLVDAAADGDGAVATGPLGVEPLAACYRTHTVGQLRAALDAGTRRAQSIAAWLDLQRVDPAAAGLGDPAHLLANVNTPEEYARVQ